MPRLQYDVVFNIDQGSAQTLEQSLNNMGSRGNLEGAKNDTKEINQNFRAISQSSEAANQNFRALNKSSSDTSDNIGRIDDATKSWASSIASVNQGKFIAVQDASNNLRVSLGRSSNNAKELRGALNLANSGLERTSQEAGDLQRRMSGVGRATQGMSKNLKGAKGQTEQFNKTANNSNQILFSFGDAIQDGAQFSQGFGTGMRAVGNNLTFASEQIAIMTNKAGGMKAGLKSLAGAMFGPAGIILAINTAVTAVTLWTQSMDKAARDAEKLSKEVKELREELDLLSPRVDAASELLESVFPDASKAENLRRELQTLSSVEAQLLSRRDQLRGTEANQLDGLIEQAERRLEITRMGATELQNLVNKGVIRRADAEKIINDRVEVQRRAQEQLSDLKQEEAALTNSIKEVNEDQVTIRSKLQQEEAFLTSEYGKQLQRMLEMRRQAEGLAKAERARAQVSITGGPLNQEEMQGQLENALSKTDEMLKQNTENIKTVNDFIFQNEVAAAEGIAKKKLQIERNYWNNRRKLIQAGLSAEAASELALKRKKEQIADAEAAIDKQKNQARVNRTLTALQSIGTGMSQLFEKQKGVAVAGAIINAGAAIVRQFKDLPLWAAIPSAALVAAKTAKQIQQITSIEEGDERAPSVGGGGGSVQTGFNTSEVTRGNQPNPRIAQDANTDRSTINVELRTEADDRVISAKAERGKKKRSQDAIQVRA